MAELTDLELLSQLRDVLDTPPVRPDAASLARLHVTLAELEHESEPVSITTAVRHRTGTRRSTTNHRRRLAGRSSVLVAGAVAAALTAGVAAAAVVTNTLPGPTRAFAYGVGLPVA